MESHIRNIVLGRHPCNNLFFPFFFSFLYDHLKFQESNPNFILLHFLRQKSLRCSRGLCPDKDKCAGKKWKDQLPVFVEEELSCSSHYATDGVDSLMAKEEEAHPVYPATVSALHNITSWSHIRFFSSPNPTSQPSRSEWIWIICKNIN